MPGNDLRFPTLSVLANGAEIAGVTEAHVSSNNHFGADRFTLCIALSATDAAWWSSTDQLLIDLRLALGGTPVSLIQGEADAVEIDPIRRTLRVTGRDLSARLIDARTQESFQNQTSSQIAETLAARHGLQAAVTTTATPVGRYYQLEHDRITLNQFSRATTEWDLLVYLARKEGFDLYVSGSTLHFAPPSSSTASPLPIAPSDVLDLRLERALTLARDIEVTVKSWNSRSQAAFTQTARASRGTGPRTTAPQRYILVRPNLQPDDALQLAQATLAELSRHERVASLTMPGDLTLTARSRIALTGTGTDFDQIYEIAELDRSLSIERGFVQHIRAKNSSMQSQTTIPAGPAIP